MISFCFLGQNANGFVDFVGVVFAFGDSNRWFLGDVGCWADALEVFQICSLG